MNHTPRFEFSRFDGQMARSVAVFAGAVLALLFLFDALAGQTTLSNILKAGTYLALFISALKLFTPKAQNSYSKIEILEKPQAHQMEVIERDVVAPSSTQEDEDTFHVGEELEATFQEFIQAKPEVAEPEVQATEAINRELPQPVEVIKDTQVKEELPVQEAPVYVEESEDQATQSHFNQTVSHYEALIEAIAQEENIERGKKQKEFFSHQNDAEDRVYLGANISKIVGLSEQYHNLITFGEVDTLLGSVVHEHRIVAVWILVQKFKHAGDSDKKEIVDFYIERRDQIDNWDMTDLAARNIIGAYVHESQETETLATLIESDSLWDKRSALMATHTSIAHGETSLGLFVMEKVHHIQDELVQSAIGWVLKELFKQNEEQAVSFMKEHFNSLSKQAIRIGTERMDKTYRKAFLRGEFEPAVA